MRIQHNTSTILTVAHGLREGANPTAEQKLKRKARLATGRCSSTDEARRPFGMVDAQLYKVHSGATIRIGGPLDLAL